MSSASDLPAVLADLNDIAARERIARDLHEVVVGRLEHMRELIEQRDLDEAVLEIDRTRDAIRRAMQVLRLEEEPPLLTEMRGVVDDYAPLLRFTPVVRVVGDLGSVPPEVARSLAPVLREALSNVARHSAADSGEIEVAVEHGDVRLAVLDDGAGLPKDVVERGLAHARRRAEALGGSLDVRRRQPRGTAFVWQVPLLSAG